MTQDLLEVFQSMDFSNKDEGITLNDRVLIIDGMNTFIRSLLQFQLWMRMEII